MISITWGGDVWFDTVCRLAHRALVVPLCAGRYAPPRDRCRGDLSLCSALTRTGLLPNKVTIEHWDQAQVCPTQYEKCETSIIFLNVAPI